MNNLGQEQGARMKTMMRVLIGFLMAVVLFSNVPVYARGECSTYGPWKKEFYACGNRQCWRWVRDEFKCSKQQCKDSPTDCNADLNCLWKQSVPEPSKGILGAIGNILSYLASDESGVCTIVQGVRTSSLDPSTSDDSSAFVYLCPEEGVECEAPAETVVV